ncbi:MAG: ketoacyl-ACP synthase III [Dysgonamonadaceae bacterium]|jgi:3-oxoacyl-[acyl-carrier-protein] synthase-3|nr:ketoacyl-ACP synthase III [Dysgonamonadaceae bacterium]
MSKIHAVITGIGAYAPRYRLTNAELSTIVDTSDEWITKRIGIKERRILKPDEGVGISYLAEKAIEDLKSKNNFNPLEIEAIVFATTTPDYMLPNTACLVAYKTGMNNAFAFDLSAACSGFLYGLEVGRGFIVSGIYKKVLVIAGDVLSVITNYKDRNTCPIFSDACGVALLEATTEDFGIMDSILRSDGNSLEYLNMYGGGSVNPSTHETIDKDLQYIRQEGKVVFKHAITSMTSACEELTKRNNLTKDNIDWLVPHQANLRIIDAVVSRMDIPREKVTINIENYGNSSAGTIPLCMREWESKFRKGDNIILTTFGAGFTWGATYLKWGYNSTNSEQ